MIKNLLKIEPRFNYCSCRNHAILSPLEFQSKVEKIKNTTLEDKVAAILKLVGSNHSAYKQSVMHLDEHCKNNNCCDSKKWCVIEFEFLKTI